MAADRPRSGATFGLVAGLLLGALTVSVVMPRGRERSVATAPEVAGVPAGPQVRPTGEAAPAGAGAGTGTGTGTATPAADAATSPAAGASSVQNRPASADAGPGGSETTSPTRAAGAPAQPVRGVTDTTVRIGLAAIDLGALRTLGPSFDIGDRRKQVRALLEGWKRSGAVPVHGRRVEVVVRDYGVLSEEQKRAACIGLIEDDDVFAVLADPSFGSGVDCVAREKKTPLLMSESRPDELFQRNSPWLFTMQMSQSRLLRNWIHWAHQRGALRNKTIGLYYFDDAQTETLVDRTIRTELRRLGYRIAAEATTRSELGGPQDSLAVQRFRAAGVDLAMLLRSKTGFMQQAEAQGYRPTYIESDLGFGTSDTTTSTYPAAHYDGTFAMTGIRYGEVKGGTIQPLAAACVANYEAVHGERVDPRKRDAEWGSIVGTCDIGSVLLHALQQAGRNLTPQSFVAGLETVRGKAMGLLPDVTFTASKHHGVEQQRTLQWQAACRCWRVAGPLGPLFVP